MFVSIPVFTAKSEVVVTVGGVFAQEENGMKKAFSFGVKDVVQKFHKTQSGLSSLQKASYRVDSRVRGGGGGPFGDSWWPRRWERCS